MDCQILSGLRLSFRMGAAKQKLRRKLIELRLSDSLIGYLGLASRTALFSGWWLRSRGLAKSKTLRHSTLQTTLTAMHPESIDETHLSRPPYQWRVSDCLSHPTPFQTFEPFRCCLRICYIVHTTHSVDIDIRANLPGLPCFPSFSHSIIAS